MNQLEQTLFSAGWVRGNGDNWYTGDPSMKSPAHPFEIHVADDQIRLCVYEYGEATVLTTIMIFETVEQLTAYLNENGVLYPSLPGTPQFD